MVRMTIVPAVMSLFDRAAWWLPRWLDRALPKVDIEAQAWPPTPTPCHSRRYPRDKGSEIGDHCHNPCRSGCLVYVALAVVALVLAAGETP